MRACWLKWVGRDWSISADYIWLKESDANNESEMALIQAHTGTSNMSFSEFVRRAALEKVEDMVDIEAFNEALMEDDGTRYSMADAMRMAMKGE